MEWEFSSMVAAVGAISLVIQLGIAGWDNRREGTLRTPLPVRQVLREWAVYMVIFIIASLLLTAILPSEWSLMR